ncbi:MAG: hypothetical protein KY464_17905 [Gemmatimonadetes bacterium]|nr:hypothetical protein [Gemmatimonadota bacterium]
MRLFRPGGALLWGLLCASTAADAQDQPRLERLSFRAHGFSLAVPSEWLEIPDSAIKARAAATPPPPGTQAVALRCCSGLICWSDRTA